MRLETISHQKKCRNRARLLSPSLECNVDIRSCCEVSGRRSLLPASSFPYRILIVDDEPSLQVLAKALFGAQGYEVLGALDGFEGLAALKESLPDIIISDLQMPNMDGFEFLSVVRRRFPAIPVIVISGEFSGMSVPRTVLADAFFPKGGYHIEVLFEKIIDLLHELPTRPNAGNPNQAAVWVKNDNGTLAVTCSECLRTFPVTHVSKGPNEAQCDFCSALIRFEIIGERPSTTNTSQSSPTATESLITSTVLPA